MPSSRDPGLSTGIILYPMGCNQVACNDTACSGAIAVLYSHPNHYAARERLLVRSTPKSLRGFKVHQSRKSMLTVQQGVAWLEGELPTPDCRFF